MTLLVGHTVDTGISSVLADVVNRHTSARDCENLPDNSLHKHTTETRKRSARTRSSTFMTLSAARSDSLDQQNFTNNAIKVSSQNL